MIYLLHISQSSLSVSFNTQVWPTPTMGILHLGSYIVFCHCDDIVFQSDDIIYGFLSLWKSPQWLYRVYKSCYVTVQCHICVITLIYNTRSGFTSGIVPSAWSKCIINPIPKCSNSDPSVPGNLLWRLLCTYCFAVCWIWDSHCGWIQMNYSVTNKMVLGVGAVV